MIRVASACVPPYRLAPSLFVLACLGCANRTPASEQTSSVPAAAQSVSVSFAPAQQGAVIQHAALFPETIVYDAQRDRFMVGSFREGAVFEVDAQGQAKPVTHDERLSSVLGIALDEQRNRLWAVSSDLGSALRPSAEGAKKAASVGVYDLATGAPLHFVQLAALYPGAHLANGIALDVAGNGYVTDSFSPVIYKVDSEGRASVFLHDERFAGEGINLNGVVVHRDGYLLVIKKSDGVLFKIPLENPSAMSKVEVARTFEGGDGLLLASEKQLVLIANQVPGVATNAAFTITSEDGFATARVDAMQALGDVYPTTAVLRGDKLFVLYSKLNELIQAAPEQKAALRTDATILEIGRLH